MLRSSSSCLLGRFLSFTAKSSFLHLRGSVPRRAMRGRGNKETGVSEVLACHCSHPPVGGGNVVRAMGGRGQLVAPSRGNGGQYRETGVPPSTSPKTPRMGPTFHGRWGVNQTVHPGSPGPVLVDTCCPRVIINSTHFFFKHVLVSIIPYRYLTHGGPSLPLPISSPSPYCLLPFGHEGLLSVPRTSHLSLCPMSVLCLLPCSAWTGWSWPLSKPCG